MEARISSPLGPLLATVTPIGLVRLTIGAEPDDTRQIDPADDHCLDLLQWELAQYFAGELREFTVPLDWSLSSGARLTVLRALHDTVPYGHTVSYGQLATTAGKPRAARFVGNCMAGNPIPILVPCHRVLRSDGDLGGYSLGPQAKRRLLGLEGSTERPTEPTVT